MIVNLIKHQQMFSLTLPQKIKGRYPLCDLDSNGKKRELVGVEAVKNKWFVKSNRNITFYNADDVLADDFELTPQSLYNGKIVGESERVILVAEDIEKSRQSFKKLLVRKAGVFSIGRAFDNIFCYDSKLVSSKHAQLTYSSEGWKIVDVNSTNGTYVNGYRVSSRDLKPGDIIYIMGLSIVIGFNFISVNNPDNMLKINSDSFAEYIPQPIDMQRALPDVTPRNFFYPAPRFFREINRAEINIDPPPQREKIDEVPLALMLGPSLTMGLTSVSSGIFSVISTMQSGGSMLQAYPALIMSGSMLLGTVLWPILTKKHEKKLKKKAEQNRQTKYLAYLTSKTDEIKQKCQEQRDILNENFVSPAECTERLSQVKTNLWDRTAEQSDFMCLRLGTGTLPLDAEVKYPEKQFSLEDDNLQNAMYAFGTQPKELSGVPVGISFRKNNAVGIYGEDSQVNGMLKAIILQLISLYCYNEVKIMLINGDIDKDEWNFVKVAPHFWSDDKSARFIASNFDEVKVLSAYVEQEILPRTLDKNVPENSYSPYYVIICSYCRLAEKCEALHKIIGQKGDFGYSLIYASSRLSDLPKEMKTVIFAYGANSRIYDRNDSCGRNILFTADSVSSETLDKAALEAANITLDLSIQRYSLPSSLTFMEMYNASKIEHLNSLTRWKESNPAISLAAPIGIDQYGNICNLDLHEKIHGPHGLVAGMTGSGKSEFIITYILSLAVNYHPDEVSFILIDYKGGGLAGAFEDEKRGVKLPHLAGTITNLDGSAVKRSLISIQSELRRRQAIFNEARNISNEGTMDIYKYQQLYRDKIVDEPVPHLFIISDEFAELKTQQPEFMDQLISAARIGRSLGVHLILATQKPSGVVDDQIWSNSKFRVCLKVQEKADSQDMIKRPDAAELSQAGRFYLQVGYNELFTLGQSAWCGADYVSADTVEHYIDTNVRFVDHLGRTVMNLKPKKEKASDTASSKQIVEIVKYLSELAAEENISTRSLWLPPIPEFIYIDDLEKKYGKSDGGNTLCPVIGEYDDPFNQRQSVLTMPLSSEGNCVIFGAAGNGKATLITTLCYSLILHHTPDELNIYIMDFGAESLKVFETAPHVGGVVISSEHEKLVNLFKMLCREANGRKKLFADYGGSYEAYCAASGKKVPNILVVLNNFAGFVEQYQDLLDKFMMLTRDCVKFGIFFVAAACGLNEMGYRIRQNFKLVYTLQLNDPTDYMVAVGKTDGLVPSRYKGRGLVMLDKVYEFQTAYCKNVPDTQEYIREFCAALAASAAQNAKLIPVLPDIVDLEYVRGSISGLKKVPIGVEKKSLNISTVNLEKSVVLPVFSGDVAEMAGFVDELIKVISVCAKVIAVDAENLLMSSSNRFVAPERYEELVAALFNETVKRNNTYKDSNMNPASLEQFNETVYVFYGFKHFYEMLSDDGKDKMKLVLEKSESIYKQHFVIAECSAKFGEFTYEEWYKRQIHGSEGLWIGNGITDQYLLKINKLTNELYEEVESGYGYIFARNRPVHIKLLSSIRGEDDENG